MLEEYGLPFVLNIIGVVVVLGLAYAASTERKKIDVSSVIIMFVLQLLITWLMLSTSIGAKIINTVAEFFLWLIRCSMSGIQFVFGELAVGNGGMAPFFFSVLMPIIFIVVFFDILTFLGILPALINTIGWLLSKLTRAPRFESFFATQVMFLGNNEVLAITRDQLGKMNDKRLLTACLLGMSCISVGVIGGYMQLIHPTYVLIAIPLNAVGALIVTSMLNPYKVTKEEDVIYKPTRSERQNFFAFITNSMLTGGKLALIIAAALMGFTALITCIDSILNLIDKRASLENAFALIFSPFAYLMGVQPSQIFTVAQFMGVKLATNEFVAMGKLHPILPTLNRHTEAVISTFLVSFCNFTTIGIILGSVRTLFNEEKTAFIAAHTWRLLLSGILVSLLTAMIVGLFIW